MLLGNYYSWESGNHSIRIDCLQSSDFTLITIYQYYPNHGIIRRYIDCHILLSWANRTAVEKSFQTSVPLWCKYNNSISFFRSSTMLLSNPKCLEERLSRFSFIGIPMCKTHILFVLFSVLSYSIQTVLHTLT